MGGMIRTGLLVSTALGLLAAPLAAQFPFVTDVDVTPGGGLPDIADVGASRIITLNAPRTYLDHGQGFFLPAGLTVRFNFAKPGPGGVALLRSDFGISINGTVEGRLGPAATDPLGGNLWFFSRGGIILGTGGRVAAGGILLSNALPSVLTSAATRSQLLADNALSFEADLGPLLTAGALVFPGASLEAQSGFLAVIAQSVSAQADTTLRAERGTLLVGAANRYTIQLARNASNDFDLVSFEVPADGGTPIGGTPIDLGGSVRGANVWLSLVGSASLTEAVVRATGTLIARAATLDQGQILLSAGAGIRNGAPALPDDPSPTRIRGELSDLEADGDIRIRQDGGQLSAARAGGDIRVETRAAALAGPTQLGGLEAGGSILVTAGADVIASGLLSAGGDIIVRGDGAVTLRGLSAGDDIVAVAEGALSVGGPGATVESRNSGPDVTRDGPETDPSSPAAPIRSLHLRSRANRVFLSGRAGGFTEGRILSAGAFDVDIETGPDGLFLAPAGLSLETETLLATSRLNVTGGGSGLQIRLGRIVSGPIRISASGGVRVEELTASGFAGIGAGAGEASVASARVVTSQGNPGSLAVTSDAGDVRIEAADVDGDLILIARQGRVSAPAGASLRFGDDLYAISGPGAGPAGIRFETGTRLASKAGFPDVPGNEILDNGDPALLVPDFDRDAAENGRRAELLALAAYPQFPPGTSGDATLEGILENLDTLVLESDSADARLIAPTASLDQLLASAGRDLELRLGAVSAPVFGAGRDATLAVTGPGPVSVLESFAGRDLAVTAGGRLTILSAAVGRDVTLTAAGLDAGGLSGAIRNARFLTTVEDLAVGGLAVSGSITFGSAGSLAAGPLEAGDDVEIAATGAVTLAPVRVGAGTDQEGDGFILSVSGASLTAQELSGADDLRIVAAGSATLTEPASAARDIRIEAGTISAAGLAAGRDLLLAAGGAVAAGAAAAGRDLAARGAALALGALSAGRDVDLETTASDLLLAGGLTVNRNLRLVSSAGLTAGGNLAAGGDAILRARDADPSGRMRLLGVAAGGRLEARAWSVQATRLAAGGGLRVTGTGPASIEADEITGDDDVDLDSGSIRVGLVRATGLGPDADGDGFNVRLSGGAGEFGAVSAATDIRARLSGALLFGDALAGRDTDIEAGAIRVVPQQAGVVAGRDARLAAAATLEAGRISAGDDATLEAGGEARLGTVEARGDGPDSEGDGSNIRLAALGARAQQLAAPGDILVEAASGPAALGEAGGVTAGRDLVVSGARLQLAGAASGRDVRLTARAGDLAGDTLSAVRDLALSASGELAFGRLEAGRDLLASAGRLLAAGPAALAAGRNARLEASAELGSAGLRVEAGADITLESAGPIRFARLQAGDDIRAAAAAPALLAGDEARTTGLGPDGEGDGSSIRLTGGEIRLARGAAAADLVLSAPLVVAGFEAGAPVSPGLSAGRDLVALGGRVRLNPGGIGRNLEVRAEAGIDLAGPAGAGGSIGLQADGAVLAAGGLTAAADVRVRSALSDVRIAGPVRAGDDLELSAGPAGTVEAGSLATTGLGPDGEGDGPVLRVRGRSATLGAVSAARDAELDVAGAASLASITTVRDALVRAGSLALAGSGAIGRDLAVTADGGFTAAGPLAAGRDIRVAAGGDVGLAALGAGRDIRLEAAGALATGVATASGSIAGRAARMTVAGAAAGGPLVLETTAGELALPGTVAAGGSVRLEAPTAAGGIIRIGRLAAGGTVDARASSILSAPGGGLVRGGGTVRLAGTGGATIDLAEVVSDDDVRLESPVIRVGTVRATGLGPDAAGDGFLIRLDGGLGTFGTLSAPTDILARFAESLAVGGAAAGRDLVLAGGSGLLSVGDATAGGVMTLAGGRLALGGALRARELRLVASGPMRIGGDAGGPGFVVPAADLARITAPAGISASTGAVPRPMTAQGPGSAAFEAAYGTGGSADLVVDRFSFDPRTLPFLGFYAGSQARIRVVGDVTPTAAGGRLVLGANPVPGLTPEAVLVSASLGSGQLFAQDCYVALLPFADIAVTALGQVVFGTEPFQQAVLAAKPAEIDVQRGTPGLPPSPANDRLWVVAETMTISAPGRIVAQNTSSVPGSFAGLVLANRQAGARVPAVLSVAGGSVVDLSGVVVDGLGRAFFGPTAARSGAIVAGAPGARFNGCAVNGQDSCLPPLADPGLGFRPEQFVPADPAIPDPVRLAGEIRFELADRGRVEAGLEEGAILIRRDEEEDRRRRGPAGR